MERYFIKYKHWKKDKVLSVVGEIVHDNPQSDRIVVRLDNGQLEDILRTTIISRDFIL